MPNDLQDLLKDLPKVDSPPMFQKEEQKKREAKFWSNYPVDPLGFTIDPRRPLVEGKDEKGRPIWQTERSGGVKGFELNEYVKKYPDKYPNGLPVDDDRIYSIPSIWNGREYGYRDENGRFHIKEKGIELAAEHLRDTGMPFPNFENSAQEGLAAQNRSDSIQEARDRYGLSGLLFER